MTAALLWDLDDTLLNTLPARMRALSHAYETCLGCKTDPLALWRSHRGGTLEGLGEKLLGDGWRRFVAVYRDRYYADAHRGIPFDGVEAVLLRCAEAGLPMAVVTSKIAWGATDELAQAGLLRYFAAIVGFDDTDNHKPDPEPVYEAMDRLLVDQSERVVFVGDSPADIFAARNAGCLSVAALWGTLDEELLLDAAPAHIARLPGEVLSILGIIEEAGPARPGITGEHHLGRGGP
jgi:pyrophosphatase PpaX